MPQDMRRSPATGSGLAVKENGPLKISLSDVSAGI